MNNIFFDDLEPQAPYANPVAAAYEKRVLSLSAAALATARHERNVRYGNKRRHRLDIYLPQNTALKNLPVLIFWHGGRWRAGYKEYNGFMAPALVSLPGILISPSYGLSPAYRFPTQLHDCLAALTWVYRNIQGYGGDKQNIYLGGHSAGGHLAALTTLRTDLYADYALPQDLIKGCFPISGTMNFAFRDIRKGSEEEQIRNLFLADPAQAEQASPLRHVANNRADFLLTCGEYDFPRVLSTNNEMREALQAASSAQVTALSLAECNHFQAHLQTAGHDNPWLKKVRELMHANA